MIEFFATAASGTERALQGELIQLGFKGVRLNSGGVPFNGEIEDAWEACLHSRIAQRIQMLLGRFPAHSEKELYEGVKSFPWEKWITPKKTLAAAAFCHSSALSHSGYIAMKIKDAVVDRLRELCGERPSVDRNDPDLRIFAYMARDRCSLYLDLSGAALFQRGYRTESGEAPIKETVAAAMIFMSGWDMKTPFLDPMCGSGTIAIEAALMSSRIAPGILREKFGFERWADFGEEQAGIMRRIRGHARRNALSAACSVSASDISPEMIEIARANARRAGVKINFKIADVREMRDDGLKRFILCNPPFNRRIEADRDLYRRMGAAFSRMHGSRVAFISSNPDAKRQIPLAESSGYEMKNGNLDCRLSIYDIPDKKMPKGKDAPFEPEKELESDP